MDNQDWLASMVGALSKLARDVDSGAEGVRSAYQHGAGVVQERFVEALLAHGALPGRLRTWTSVLVPKDGAVIGEAELDVLMLHERGVFVFESKNYSGWIFGSEVIICMQSCQCKHGGLHWRLHSGLHRIAPMFAVSRPPCASSARAC